MIFLKRHKRFIVLPNLSVNRVNIGIKVNKQNLYITLLQTIGNLHYEVSTTFKGHISPYISVYNNAIHITIIDATEINGSVQMRSINYNKSTKNNIRNTTRILISNNYESTYQKFDFITNKTYHLKLTKQHKQSMKKHILHGLFGGKLI
jgi:hypothetical protein